MSTIGFERRWNPLLSFDREAFIEALAEIPPKPADVEGIVAFSRAHGQVDTDT